MIRFRHLLSSVVFALLLLPACGESGDPEHASFGIPMINGDPDTSSDHQSVVVLQMTWTMCTGTLISPEVVLTAAHCLQGQSVSRIRVGFGNNSSGAAWRGVSEKWIHPDYDSGGYFSAPENDIGLLRLSSAPPFGVVPIPHLPNGIGITNQDIGTPLEFVGFGQTETGQTGVKMTATNNLDWVCVGSSNCTVGVGYTAAPNTICQDQDPGGPCTGDSGGPAFITRNGQEYVAGITSYGDQNCSVFGCSTKVDEFDSYIIDFIGGVVGAPCTTSVECLSGFCVDGVCCESACPGICEACNLPGLIGNCGTVPDGTACPDSDMCNGTETCQGGDCRPATAMECDDGNVCTAGSCDPASGCVFLPSPDGTPCPDGNVCNGPETCSGGVCRAGAPVDCDDHNPCTDDTCDPQSGCGHTPLPDGSSCGGGMCSEATCENGECVSRDPDSCDDQDPCTWDWCDPESGCTNDPLPDGYECGECMMCASSQCVEVEDCETGNGCGCLYGSSPMGAAAAAWFFLLTLGALLRGRRDL